MFLISENHLPVKSLLHLGRYEREVNHGHRSAIKRILEGDAPASSVLVLCISAITSTGEAMVEKTPTPHGIDSSTAANIELSDGW